VAPDESGWCSPSGGSKLLWVTKDRLTCMFETSTHASSICRLGPIRYPTSGLTVLSPCLVLPCLLPGFDVWLPNTRGNTFSRGNYHHSFRDLEYWYHSIDEYALIDNPAMINTALKVSGARKLAFVGHSQVGGVGCRDARAHPCLRQGPQGWSMTC